MSSTLYIQIDKNIRVPTPDVYLKQIAKIFCKDKTILQQCERIKVYDVPQKRPGRYVLSAMDLIRNIQDNIQDVEVTHIGEPTFILTYEGEKTESNAWNYIKTALICVIVFLGAGFSIMSFNMDAQTSELFNRIYEQVTGRVSDGFTELELMYSLGVGIGVVFFFNHFGRKKLSEDPTPIQVQMRIYEDNVDMTVMEDINRSQKGEP